jgi:hypothetical protein
MHYHPSYLGGTDKRTEVQAHPDITSKSLLKKYLKQIGLGAWLK